MVPIPNLGRAGSVRNAFRRVCAGSQFWEGGEIEKQSENRFFRKKTFSKKVATWKKSEIGENLIFSKKKLFRKKSLLEKSRYFSARLACLPSKTGMRNITSSVSALTCVTCYLTRDEETMLSGVLNLRIPPIIRTPPYYLQICFKGGFLSLFWGDLAAAGGKFWGYIIPSFWRGNLSFWGFKSLLKWRKTMREASKRCKKIPGRLTAP